MRFLVSNVWRINLSLSVKQMINAWGDITRLSFTGENRELQSELRKLYHYDDEDTCTNNCFFKIKCPVDVDTGKMIKPLRFEKQFSLENIITYWCERNFEQASKLARLGAALNLLRKLLGSDVLVGLSRMIRKESGNQIPQWNPHFRKPAPWD